MRVRSLSSRVLKWADADAVDRAVRAWAGEVARERPDVQRIGYFGSYARGDWGVGSDVDIVVIVERTGEPFDRRGAQWHPTGLPVPADVLVYTSEEWEELRRRARFVEMVEREAVWVVQERGRGTQK